MLVPQESNANQRRDRLESAETMAPASGKVRRLGAWQVASDLPSSFRYAAQGLSYGFRSQRNFRIHVFTGAAVFALGLWLELPLAQLAVLVLTVAAVLVLELINTATEAVALGLWLELPLAQLAVLVLTVAAVLVLELINTATEAVVDLAIGRQFHPLARVAKDCAAAAVLVAAISSLVIAALLMLPALLARLGV